LANLPKDSQNILGRLDDQKEANMKFPKRLRYKGRGKVLATIYRTKSKKYCVYWRMTVDGKRRTRLKDFDTYSEAVKFGETKIAEIATGKLAATLSLTGCARKASIALPIHRAARFIAGGHFGVL
jgi:hypothetical protein